MARIEILSPTSGFSVTRQPRVSGSALAAPGRGLAAVGDAFEGVANDRAAVEEAKAEARRAVRLMQVQAEATRELNDLALSFERDTDFATAPLRFEAAAQKIFERHARGVADDAEVARLFEGGFGKLAETKRVAVTRTAFAREAQATIAGLDTILPDYAGLAANAGSDVERDQIIAQGRAAIAGLAAGGFLDATDAVARDRAFLGSVDEARARRAITTDPVGAIEGLLDGTLGRNLDPVARARLVDMAAARAETDAKEAARLAEKADRAAVREAKRIGDERLREAYARDADGTLTRGFADEIRDDITPAEYRSLLKLLDPASAGGDDADAFRDLAVMLADDPGQAERLALRYHTDGLIGNDTLKETLTRARTLARQEGPRSAYERERAFLADSLAPSPLVPGAAPRQRQAEALREFDDFNESGDRPRTAAELRSRSNELVVQFAEFDLREMVLPQPRFGGVQRDFNDPSNTQAALDAAETETLRRFDAGEINRSEFDAEARIFERWRTWLEKNQAAASRGAGKK